MEEKILTYALVETLLQNIENRWPNLKPDTEQVRARIPEGLRASTESVTAEVEKAFNEVAERLVFGDTDCVFPTPDCWPIWRVKGGMAKS